MVLIMAVLVNVRSIYLAPFIVIPGLASSHLLRIVIIRAGWLELAFTRIWMRVSMAVLVTCMVAASLAWVGYASMTYREFSWAKFLATVFDFHLLLLPWAGIYFFYHYIRKDRRRCVRAGELKQRIAVMQQECEVSGTDMESMMERLQRIASLIEADPDRSREEITEFSKLLRSGYMR